MRTVPLDSAPRYSALSYVWGDPNERENIVVNSQLVSVTKNLESALRCGPDLQKIHPGPDRTFLLWVDAICIDQTNTRERVAQLSLMAKLYQDAECVFAWLGSEDRDDAFRALRPIIFEIDRIFNDPSNGSFLEKLARLEWLENHPSLCKNDSLALNSPDISKIPSLFNACWSAINDLLTCQYWTRAWVFQEAVLARRLILACPTSAMVLTDLGAVATALDAVQMYLRIVPVVKPDFLGSAVWYFLRDIIDWKPIVHIIRERNQRDSDHLLPDEAARRCALATVGFDLHATDPRDHVYSLLALTNLEIQPDYEKSPNQVYTDFSVAWLKTCQTSRLQPELLFLAYAGVGLFGHDSSSPSWVPDFSQQSQMKVKLQHGNADQGVFGRSTPVASIHIDRKSLFAPGIEIDSISKLAERKQKMTKTRKNYFEALYGLFVDFASRNESGYLKGILPLQAILRIIWGHPMSRKVTGPTVMRGLNFIKFLSIFGPKPTTRENLQGLGFTLDDTFDSTFHQKMFPVSNLDWNIRSLRAEFKDWVPIGGLTEMTELEVRLGDLSRSWTLIETEKGYLGLGPKQTMPGDLVVVLKGSDVPVILRKDGCHFLHVGTSFILGLMDGELSGCVDEGEFAMEEFVLL
ncbi:heterokaryon incompatibility protein-domain-containing protein [Dactylonectria macrodidyma]|uniref:Heterokaryon incompatibility protein-domain-containing protein n=1 Tax=Dactylonectria macrodidyma TaxID=307937 RepID=A0A9P9FL85_9HYPO|nr:heterokaryon incompatibility protein-domain-containing protein [Dactylonectria macrodidyma]